MNIVLIDKSWQQCTRLSSNLQAKVKKEVVKIFRWYINKIIFIPLNSHAPFHKCWFNHDFISKRKNSKMKQKIELTIAQKI